MKYIIFLFIILQVSNLLGQKEIKNLSFSGCFEGNANEMYVSKLIVSFDIKKANDIQFIYLYYNDRNIQDRKPDFFLIEVKNMQNSEVKIKKNDNSLDRVTITKIITKKEFKSINFIRVYVSDTQREYSNTLFFGK